MDLNWFPAYKAWEDRAVFYHGHLVTLEASLHTDTRLRKKRMKWNHDGKENPKTVDTKGRI